MFNVPPSWVLKEQILDKNGEEKDKYFCWWPDSNDNTTSLIVNREEPDFSTWKKMPGRILGLYESLEAAERALKKCEGTGQTEEETGSGTSFSETDTISKNMRNDKVSTILTEIFGDLSSNETDASDESGNNDSEFDLT